MSDIDALLNLSRSNVNPAAVPFAPKPTLTLVKPAPASVQVDPLDERLDQSRWNQDAGTDWRRKEADRSTFLLQQQQTDPKGENLAKTQAAMFFADKMNLDPAFAYTNLESLITNYAGEPMAPQPFFTALRNIWKTGWLENQIQELYYLKATGQGLEKRIADPTAVVLPMAGLPASSDLDKRIEALRKQIPEPDMARRGIVAKAVEWAMGSMPLVLYTALQGAKWGMVTSISATIAAQTLIAPVAGVMASTGVGAIPALGAEILGSTAVFGGAFAIGTAVGTGTKLNQLMIGMTYEALEQFRDSEGRKLSPEIMSTIAIPVGTVVSLLEGLQIRTRLGAWSPALKKAFGDTVTDVVRSSILKSIGGKFSKWAAASGIDILTEGVENGAQQLVQMIGENIAMSWQERMRGGQFDKHTVEEISRSVLEQTWVGIAASIPMMLPGQILSPLYRRTFNVMTEEEYAEYKRQLANREMDEFEMDQTVERTQTMRVSAVMPAAIPARIEASQAVVQPAVPVEGRTGPTKPPAASAPTTFAAIAQQIVKDVKAWQLIPSEWQQIEAARRGPSDAAQVGVSVYKDAFAPYGPNQDLRAALHTAAPHFTLEEVDGVSLFIQVLAEAQGLTTKQFTDVIFAQDVFATPQQMPNLLKEMQELEQAKAGLGPGVGAEAEQAIAEVNSRVEARLAASRGVTQFLDDGKALIHLMQTASFGTVVHEMAHVLRRWLPTPLMEQAGRWAGAVDGFWSREAEEKFANGFVDYLRTGVAPAPELTNVFQRFAEWLEYIYKAFRDRLVLSPEITKVFDELFTKRNSLRLGERLKIQPNPRPADSVNIVYEVDDRPAVETDPAKVADEDFLKQSEYQASLRSSYFDEQGDRRFIIGPDGNPAYLSSRETPIASQHLRVGQWMIDDQVKLLYGHEIAQLRKVTPEHVVESWSQTKESKPGDFVLTEDLVPQNVEGRGFDSERYAGWLRQGMTPPPICAVETDRGTFTITDGHRRAYACLKTGLPIYAWVWPTMDHPKGLTEEPSGKVQKVGLTYEAVKGKPWVDPGKQKYLHEIVTSEQKKLNKMAEEYFGTTENPKEAGYILSNGKMLDFSGRHILEEYAAYLAKKKVGPPPVLEDFRDQRTVDHHAIPDSIIGPGNETEKMTRWMSKSGAMRVDHHANVFETQSPVTEKQYATIAKMLPGMKNFMLQRSNSQGYQIGFDEFLYPNMERFRYFFDNTEFLRAETYLHEIDPREQEKFNQQSIDFFGTTNDPRKSAWILSTGQMLDFDNRWGASETVMLGGKAAHRMIGVVPTVGVMDSIKRAMQYGAVRMDWARTYSILQTSGIPTEQQFDAIEGVMRGVQKLEMEYSDPLTGDLRAYHEFDRPTIQNVRDFFEASKCYSPKYLFDTDPWLLRSAETVRMKIRAKMPGKQVKGAMVNSGVTLDELHWFGLDDWLQDDQLYEPNDILAFIAKNAVRVEERVLGTAEPPLTPGGPELIAPAAHYTQTQWRLEGGANYREILFKLGWKPIAETEQVPKKGFEQRVQAVNDEITGLNNELREQLVAHPNDGEYVDRVRQRETELLTQRRDTMMESRYRTFEEPVRTGHFAGHTNVLAWIRTQDFIDVEGKKLFLVDEFQSELAEATKHEGFGDPVRPENYYRRMWESLLPFREVRATLANELDRIEKVIEQHHKDRLELDQKWAVWLKENPGKEIPEKVQQQLDTAYQSETSFNHYAVEIRKEYNRAQTELDQEYQRQSPHYAGTPPVPFIASRRWGIIFQGKEYKDPSDQTHRFATIDEARGYLKRQKLAEEAEALGWPATSMMVVDLGYIENTRAWAGMEFRRALRWAVEHGYDALAWTDGATQNKRWNLARLITQLDWEKQDDGRYAIRGYRNGGDTADLEQRNIEPEKLGEWVGKDVAERIRGGQNDLTGLEMTLLQRGLTVDLFQKTAGPGNSWYIRYANGDEMGTWATEDDARSDARRQDADIRGLTAEPLKRKSGTLHGLSLESGGGFMKLLYDKIVAGYAAKYVKQWGGEVGETKVLNFQKATKPSYRIYWEDERVVGIFDDLEKADEWVRKRNDEESLKHPGAPEAYRPYAVHDANMEQAGYKVTEAIIDGERVFRAITPYGDVLNEQGQELVEEEYTEGALFKSRQQAWDFLNTIARKELTTHVWKVDITQAMKESVKEGRFQQFLMEPDSHEQKVEGAVLRGEAVPDEVLEAYGDRDWAKQEIAFRGEEVERIRQGQYANADEYIVMQDTMRGPDESPKPYDYWMMLWGKAGGDIETGGGEFTALTPAEANKKFIKSVSTEQDMTAFLIGLEQLTHEDPLKKGSGKHTVFYDLPRAIYFAYLSAKKSVAGTMDIEHFVACLKLMKAEPERYRELEAAMGDEWQQRQIEAEKELAPAEESRLRNENSRLRAELKAFRAVEQDALRRVAAAKELYAMTRAEWAARATEMSAEQKKRYLASQEGRIREAIVRGRTIPPEVLNEWPALKELSASRQAGLATPVAAAPVVQGAPAAQVPPTPIVETVEPAAAAAELPIPVVGAEKGELTAAYADSQVEIANAVAAVRLEWQKQVQELKREIEEQEEISKTEKEMAGEIERLTNHLAYLEKRIAVADTKERMAAKIIESEQRRREDRENWKKALKQRQETERVRAMIKVIHQLEWRVPRMRSEVQPPLQSTFDAVNSILSGKDATVELTELRNLLAEEGMDFPGDYLDALDDMNRRSMRSFTSNQVEILLHAITHWIQVNRDLEVLRIGEEYMRHDQAIDLSIAEMKEPHEAVRALERLDPTRWEKFAGKVSDTTQALIGLGQVQYNILTEMLGGAQSIMHRLFTTAIEAGRRVQLETKFKYLDYFEKEVARLAIPKMYDWLRERDTYQNGEQVLELSRSKKISLYLHSLSEDNRGSILKAGMGSRTDRRWRNKPMKVDESLLEDVAARMTPQELDFVRVVQEIMQMTGDDMSPIFEQRYGYPMPRPPHYWHKDTMPVGRSSSLEEQRALSQARRRNLAPGVPKGRTKERRGAKVSLYLNNVEYDLMQTINYASLYTGLEIPVYQASKLLRDRDFIAAMGARYSPSMLKSVEQGIRDIIGEEQALSSFERIMAQSRYMMQVAFLGNNPFSMLKIFLGFANGLAHVRTEYLVRGMADVFTHYKTVDNFHSTFSPLFRDRVEAGFTRDIAEEAKLRESGKLAGAKYYLKRGGMAGIRWADRTAINVVMRGAFLQAMEELQKGEISEETKRGLGELVEKKNLKALTPEKRFDLALRFADWVQTRTQDQHLPEYRSGLSRESAHAGLAKFFTMFGSNTNTNLNILIRSVVAYQHGPKTPRAASRLMKVGFLMIVAVPLAEAFVNHLRDTLLRRYGDDEEKWRRVLANYANNVASMSYFVRDIANEVINKAQGWNFREVTIPPLQIANDFMSLIVTAMDVITHQDMAVQEKMMNSFWNKLIDFLIMISQLPLYMPKRYLQELIRKAGE